MAAIAPVQPRLHAGPWAPASALQAVVRAVGAATEQSAAGRPFFGAAAGSVPGMRNNTFPLDSQRMCPSTRILYQRSTNPRISSKIGRYSPTQLANM
ncbi:hypothetical protein DIPPA_27211 [Diplonema papillatum]|nr:hypothetical protein DIPPA_27211 [Diplonema papillatum]